MIYMYIYIYVLISRARLVYYYIYLPVKDISVSVLIWKLLFEENQQSRKPAYLYSMLCKVFHSNSIYLFSSNLWFFIMTFLVKLWNIKPQLHLFWLPHHKNYLFFKLFFHDETQEQISIVIIVQFKSQAQTYLIYKRNLNLIHMVLISTLFRHEHIVFKMSS